MSQILKLKKILDEDSEDVNINFNGAEFETGEDDGQNEAPKGYCVECKDQRAVMFCENCAEDFCEVCYTIIHRNGSRKKHVFVMLEGSKKGKDDVIMEDVKPSLDEQPDINSTENVREMFIF
ncbi:UPF0652 protein [Zancudomyces culisetae]|uniref:UPF0652 protein n=1 Tax=Zancudomyces culisetae TaxID=1213189 RepID=A0A1R1PQB6_ZANCU|nr:UPF0652 protein [Zancudomyces culisetae]|eukprot:OMH83160.1 UPF0652 protein [Zancudomyces culisetae]